MKMLVLSLVLLVVSSCDFKIAVKEENIPDFKEVYLIEINPDKLASIRFTGEVVVSATHFHVDWVKNDRGLVIDYVPSTVRESFILNQNAIQSARQKLNEELGDVEESEDEVDDEWGPRCVAYDRWIKSRKIENQRDVPMSECVQAIRKQRSNYVVFWVYLREFFLGLIQEKFHSLTRG